MNTQFYTQGMFSSALFSCYIHISSRGILMSPHKVKSIPVHTWSCLWGATINGKFHDSKPFFVISVFFLSQMDSFFWAAATGNCQRDRKEENDKIVAYINLENLQNCLK